MPIIRVQYGHGFYGPFCEGWLKVYGKQGVQKVKNLIYGLEAVMSEHGISTISEIYDGDPPHAPGEQFPRHGALERY